MMVDFFGTTPGLLSLAGLAVLLILVSVGRRLVARGRARRMPATSATSAIPSAPTAGLPRWAAAAVAAWAVTEEGGARGRAGPSAEAWAAAAGAAAAGGQDPWLAWVGPERRNVGVTK